MSTATISLPNNKANEWLTWWLPLVAIAIFALVLRLVYLDRDLPANEDPDEFYYYVWARQVRVTGKPDVESGLGYPPGFLYLLAVEQPVLEAIRGPALNKSIDYYVLARNVNALFGVACVFLVAYLARRVTRSKIVGLAAGLMTTVLGIMVHESRRGAANAPWTFFTILAFIVLLEARDRKSIAWLYASLGLGIVSFLFKYQSGVFFCLPFLYGLIYFRHHKKIYIHMAVWAGLLALLLAWLIFDYQIFEIVHTPSTDTASVVTNGNLTGLQTILYNWSGPASAVGGQIYLWASVFALIFAIGSLLGRLPVDWIDGSAVVSFFIFNSLFYVLMSLFKPAAASKWLAFLALVTILALAGLFVILKLLALALQKVPADPVKRAAPFVVPAAFLVFMVSQAQRSITDGYWVYQNVYLKPSSLNELNKWYDQQSPQGGRVVSEAVKMVHNYVYAPDNTHVNVVHSIFEESAQAYRERGYDYLIWNNMKSVPTDSLAELDARLAELEQQGAREILRLKNGDYTGPDIVVFKLDPLPQHETYAWFTDAISFRGYDLNKETLKPGDEVNLTLYWESARTIPNNYIVFIHIFDPQTGQLLAGQDGPPDNGLTPTWKWQGDMQFIRDSHTLTIPADAKPGAYTLRIGLYDADSQARVTVLDLNYQPTGDSFVLQELHVEP